MTKHNDPNDDRTPLESLASEFNREFPDDKASAPSPLRQTLLLNAEYMSTVRALCGDLIQSTRPANADLRAIIDKFAETFCRVNDLAIAHVSSIISGRQPGGKQN